MNAEIIDQFRELEEFYATTLYRPTALTTTQYRQSAALIVVKILLSCVA